MGSSGVRAGRQLHGSVGATAGAVLVVVAVVLLALAPVAAASSPAFVLPGVPTAPTLPPRIFGVAASAPGGASMVVAGGEAPSISGGSATPLLDTWTFDGASWTPRCGTSGTPTCGPGARVYAGAGTAPGGVVLFGGADGDLGDPGVSLLGDTWRFDGSTWSQVCDASTCGPPARAMPSMAGNGSQVVLFSGLGGTTLDDTWTFDGSTWTQVCGSSISKPCGPPARAAGTLGWDGQEFVLFGGADLGGTDALFDDTWTFDGSAWTQVCGSSISKPCGPPARALASAASLHHPRADLDGLVLAGGGDLFSSSLNVLRRDVWFFRSGDWTELPTPWDSGEVSFGNTDPPPAGAAPLLPLLGSLTTTCRVGYSAVGVSAAGDALETHGAVAGWDVAGTGSPSCATAAATTTTTTAVPSATESTVAPAPSSTAATPPTLPVTGAADGRGGVGLALGLGGLGLLLLGISGPRRRARRGPASR